VLYDIKDKLTFLILPISISIVTIQGDLSTVEIVKIIFEIFILFFYVFSHVLKSWLASSLFIVPLTVRNDEQGISFKDGCAL